MESKSCLSIDPRGERLICTSCVLNVCFPYTSRDEITTAVKATVEDYSKPLSAQARPFSQTRITQKIKSRNLSTSRTNSPTPSVSSDVDDSVSSTTTLYPESPPTDSQEGTVYPDPETITADTIGGHMFTAGDPPLDLLVRTSEKRLSDFMLWQCHQDTKIVFLNCLWPEFDLWQFLPVLVEWQWSQKHIKAEESNGKVLKTKVR
jgi:ditrans,polycis-polyprenyl diphosphate synthase